jgi:hypothetical protein
MVLDDDNLSAATDADMTATVGITSFNNLNTHRIDLRCTLGYPGMISMITITMTSPHRAGDDERDAVREDLALGDGRAMPPCWLASGTSAVDWGGKAVIALLPIECWRGDR